MLNSTILNKLKEKNYKRVLQSNQSDSETQAMYFKYKEIEDSGMLREWINQVLFPKIYKPEGNIYFRSNYVLGEPMVHMIVRNLDSNKNDDPHSKIIFPYFVGRTTYKLFDHLNSNAYTKDITLTDGTIVTHTKESDGSTLNAIGGYYLTYPRDYEQAKQLDYLAEKSLIMPTWTTILYAFFYINGNTQLTGSTTLFLIRTPSGIIEKHIESHMCRDYYENSLDAFRAFLEIIFVMIT